MEELSHLDEEGNVKMVDVTNKISNNRIAKAEGKITMLPETILAIQSSLEHKPFNPNSEDHLLFIRNLEAKISLITKDVPHIKF